MNILQIYYNKLGKLRMASYLMKDVYMLEDAADNYDEVYAQKLQNKIITKYEKDLITIGKFYSNRPIITGKYSQIYKDKNEDDIICDLLYLRDCLVAIGAVRFNFESSLQELLKKL